MSRYRQSKVRNPETYCIKIGEFAMAFIHHGSAANIRKLEIRDTTNITSI